MRSLCTFAVLLCACAAVTFCQDNRVFDWTAANSETIPMEPASVHAGRVYHPAAGGGNMHVQIDSRYPVTVAMTWADEWNTSMQHPDAPGTLASSASRSMSPARFTSVICRPSGR